MPPEGATIDRYRYDILRFEQCLVENACLGDDTIGEVKSELVIDVIDGPMDFDIARRLGRSRADTREANRHWLSHPAFAASHASLPALPFTHPA